MIEFLKKAASALVGGVVFFGISFFYHHYMTDYSALEKNGIDTVQELSDRCLSNQRIGRDGCFIFIRATVKTSADIFEAYPDIKPKCSIDGVTVEEMADRVTRWAKENPNSARDTSADSIIVSMLRDSPTCGRVSDF